MLRPVLALALLAFATPAIAQEIRITPWTPQAPDMQPSAEPAAPDPFVQQSDQCGASRYRH